MLPCMNDFKEILKKDISLNRTLSGQQGSLVRREIDGAVVIVGDLHGEIESLEQIINRVCEMNRELKGEDINWFFLGDYVDRGQDSLELLTRLISFRLKNPDRVLFLRGNHEDWRMNLHYGFAWELHLHNMDSLSGLIIEWYESLPLIAVIPPVAMVHGGPPFPIPASFKDISDISFKETRGRHVLWSDPDDEYYTNRGGGTRAFNDKECQDFLRLVKCSFLVRGHQHVPLKGYKINFGTCITLFSAACGLGWPRSFIYLRDLKGIKDLKKHIYTV